MSIKWMLPVFFVFYSVFGQGFKYDNCPDLQADEFTSVSLFTALGLGLDLHEPVKLAFDMDENGVVDIYFIELRNQAKVILSTARVRVYKGSTKQVSTVMEITVTAERNDGLSGIALDPDFKENGWFYIQYQTPKEFSDRAENSVFRLSRFTMNDYAADLSSEAIIIEIPAYTNKFHTGGGMQFDAYGDLWWGIGDNALEAEPPYRTQEGSGNTASLIGKILRIRPLPVSEGTANFGPGITYAIPSGNLGEVFAAKAQAGGNAGRAADFRDETLVRPEIYTMGNRNPYTLTIDPVRRWVTFGDCGPDGRGGETEESSLVTEPGNHGWPFFAGNNQALRFGTHISDSWNEDKDPLAPVNDAPTNNGLKVLPPAVPATYSYPQQCAMTGPIYRYDPDLNSQVKMPPHFHRAWFITDFNKSWIMGFKMDSAGKEIQYQNKLTDNVFSGLGIKNPLDFQVGPDGALYVVNYGPDWYNTNAGAGIRRIEYRGDCRPEYPEFPRLEKAGCTDPGFSEYDSSIPEKYSNPAACEIPTHVISETSKMENYAVISSATSHGIKVQIDIKSDYTLKLFNSDGRQLDMRRESGRNTIHFNNVPHSGIYFLQVNFQGKQLSKRFVVL